MSDELTESPPIEHAVVATELPVVLLGRSEQGEEALRQSRRTDRLRPLHLVEFGS